MSPAVQSQSTFERIQELRAAGDTEGWARLLMVGGLSKEERQALRLTGEEAWAYRRLKAAWGLTGRRRRTLRKQQAAYEHLCELRRDGETYWIVVLARTGSNYHKAVITGSGLASGIPQFHLNPEEAEAVKLREQGLPDECGVEWRRVRAGVYRSTDWKWYIEAEDREAWVAYRDGELWGNWNTPGQCYEARPHHYEPFASLWEAKQAIEEFGYADEGEET